MTYEWASATDVGRVRSGNEDSIHPAPGSGSGEGPLVMMVADGMGGAVAGEVASRIAVETAVAVDDTVETRVAIANSAIIDEITADPTLAGMGTTLTMGVFGPGGSVEIAHVGDSRAYLLRGGAIEQITSDHTLVAELLEAGRIEPEDVAHHPQRHLITRVLGMARRIPVDTTAIDLEPGDAVLLASDGLTGMLDDDDIAGIVADAGSVADAVAALVAAANEAGGLDNISVVLVQRSA